MSVELTAGKGPYVVAGPGTKDDFLSLVIPTFNECKNIEPLMQQLSGVLEPQWKSRYEIIVVDDNSPDGTYDTARTLASKYPPLKVMRRNDERGLATAVIRGWQAAQGNILAAMDADLQHPPEILPLLLTRIKDGADIAVASRYVQSGGVGDWGLPRRILSRGATFIAELLLPGLPRVLDPMSGFFALRRCVIDGIEMHPSGYKILLEVLVRGRKAKTVEVPFSFQLRLHGQTKVGPGLYIDYLKQLCELRRHLRDNSRKSS